MSKYICIIVYMYIYIYIYIGAGLSPPCFLQRPQFDDMAPCDWSATYALTTLRTRAFSRELHFSSFMQITTPNVRSSAKDNHNRQTELPYR